MSFRRVARGRPLLLPGLTLGRVATEPVAEIATRADSILVLPAPCDESADLAGYAGILSQSNLPPASPGIAALDEIGHLEQGDIVALDPSGTVRTLFRPGTRGNALFLTERCNSRCVMCSQPPRDVDDHGLIRINHRLIELIASGAAPVPELGITGGEPTLLQGAFLGLIASCAELLPATALHVLTNGRLFYYGSFARRLAAIAHPDLMLGIPLYADTPRAHDAIVGAHGAFAQTMIGLQNLARHGVEVEIRVVLMNPTLSRLLPLCELIYRNLPFASQVVLMGLEPVGLAARNLAVLWPDPARVVAELVPAIRFLARRGLCPAIYNLPLCAVPEELRPYCRRSISDWKNESLPECEACNAREQCSGFFSSAARRAHSLDLKPSPIRAG